MTIMDCSCRRKINAPSQNEDVIREKIVATTILDAGLRNLVTGDKRM